MSKHTCTGCDSYRQMTRRQWLRTSAGLIGGAGFLGFADPRVLYAKPSETRTADTVILLWMAGGMSHLDTLDLAPGTDHGGPYSPIQTAAEGIAISEHLPRIADRVDQLSLIRSMTGNEFDHSRASYQMHTGYPPLASIQHSTLGSIVAKYKGRSERDDRLPPYVTIGQDWAAGYLGPKYAPYYVGNARFANANLAAPQGIGNQRYRRRLALLKKFDRNFKNKHKRNDAIKEYGAHYDAALLMMRPKTARVFNLDDEPMALRERYGVESAFGQGCLLARRLAQAGVRFVEVTLGGWDTHQNNFDVVKDKSLELDVAMSALIDDLKRKEIYDRTLVVLASEFGRTPRINGTQGRDHFPQVWSVALGGGGLQTGRMIGASDAGRAVKEKPIRVGDLHATICKAIGVDYEQTNYSPDQRPFRIVKEADARPIWELF